MQKRNLKRFVKSVNDDHAARDVGPETVDPDDELHNIIRCHWNVEE
jgi:hypothetical protein